MDENATIDKPQKEILVLETTKKEILRGLSIFLLVAIVFLFLRIFLKLIGANPENIFMGFINIVSGIFLLPFFGILSEPDESLLPGRSTIDTAAFIALFCYIILIGLAMSVVQLVSMMIKSGKKTKDTVEQEKPVDTTIVDEVVE
jgi:hypothetical protein